MSLKSMNKDELKNTAMIDLATIILTKEKKAMDFHDIYEKVAEIKGFTEEEKEDALLQFYTDLNVDGQFLTVGSNIWGLKRWYPVEQIDEDITAEPKKKKTKKKAKAKKKKMDDELDMEEIVVDENTNEDYDSREDDELDDEYRELGEEEDLDEEDYDDLEDEEEDEEDADKDEDEEDNK